MLISYSRLFGHIESKLGSETIKSCEIWNMSLLMWKIERIFHWNFIQVCSTKLNQTFIITKSTFNQQQSLKNYHSITLSHFVLETFSLSFTERIGNHNFHDTILNNHSIVLIYNGRRVQKSNHSLSSLFFHVMSIFTSFSFHLFFCLHAKEVTNRFLKTFSFSLHFIVFMFALDAIN